MARTRLLGREPVPGLLGLATLTEPDADERVAAIVDVAIVGARSDGKTQFIAHAVRTLRAFAPPDLPADEQVGNDAILDVVLHATAPRPDATELGRVQHSVFRLRSRTLLRGLGLFRRIGFLLGLPSLWILVMLAHANAGAVWALLATSRGLQDPASAAVGVGLLIVGLCLALVLAQRDFIRRGDIEVVFWDVAGEHVYNSNNSAILFHRFLSALTHARRSRASASRRYGFATALICNPTSLGAEADPPYVRLQKLMPLFAGLHPERPTVLTVINRWQLVRAVCAADGDADDLVAVVPIAAGADRSAASSDQAGPRDPLPVLRRASVRQHCMDAEQRREDDVHFDLLHYDAGMHAHAEEQPWRGWEALPEAVRRTWAPPDGVEPRSIVTYRFREGPGTFEGEARIQFLRWLERAAWSSATHEAGSPIPDVLAFTAAPIRQQAIIVPEPVPEPAPPTRPSVKTEIMYPSSPPTGDGGGFSSGGT